MNIQPSYNIGSNYGYTTNNETPLTKPSYNLGPDKTMLKNESGSKTSQVDTRASKEIIAGPITSFINNAKVKTTTENESITLSSDSQKSKIESLQDFDALMRQVLVVDAQGFVHEEQMQFAIVHFLLAKKDRNLAKEYLDIFDAFIGSGTPPMSAEDAVKETLKSLAAAGKISATDAETINGISFRAGQLDSNLDSLYDNRGSANDRTIAIMKEESAIKKALAVMEQIDSKEITFNARNLDAPSNTIGQSSSSISANSINGNSRSGSEGFLWKPISESDGKLAVLLPASISNSVTSAEIHSALPPSDSTLIETGRDTNGFHNGRRIFRYSKAGANYPENCYIVAKLNDGSIETYKISEPGSRTE